MQATNQQSREAQYNMVRIFAIVMYLVAPAIYLYIAYTMQATRSVQDNMVMLIVLLAVALGELVASSFLPDMILRKSPDFKTQKAPLQQYWTIRMAMVESVFIFGLAYFFIAGNFNAIFYFYAIGAIGVVMHWPTRERFDAIADKLEAK
ncbi:MAG: hypothetical protein IPH75_00455 [bacterium]|nr:hypothetical protein [bacterium]